MASNRQTPVQPANRFATTHWSLVQAAGAPSSPDAARALEQLCQVYWQPLYRHLRWLGHQVAEAQDLTQAFVAHVIEKRLIAKADQERGKFRTYVLTSLRNFLVNDHERSRAFKRGGGRVFPMDFQAAEMACGLELVQDSPPELAFERQWAIAVLEAALTELAVQQRAAGKDQLFEALSPCLAASEDAPKYVDVSVQLGMSVMAVKKAVSRLRTQYARLIREEVARTISINDCIDDEIQNLFRALKAR